MRFYKNMTLYTKCVEKVESEVDHQIIDLHSNDFEVDSNLRVASSMDDTYVNNLDRTFHFQPVHSCSDIEHGEYAGSDKN